MSEKCSHAFCVIGEAKTEYENIAGKHGEKFCNLEITFKKGKVWEPGVVAYACKLSMWEAEAGGSLQDQGQAGLHKEFKMIMNYILKSYL